MVWRVTGSERSGYEFLGENKTNGKIVRRQNILYIIVFRHTHTAYIRITGPKCDTRQMYLYIYIMRTTLRALFHPFNWIKCWQNIRKFELATESQRFPPNYYIYCFACAAFRLDFDSTLFSIFVVYSWRCESSSEKHKNKQTQNMFYSRNANTISFFGPFDDFSFVAVTWGDLEGDANYNA